MELKELETQLKDHLGKIEIQVNEALKSQGDKSTSVVKALQTEIDDCKKVLNSVTDQLKTIQARNVPGLKDELAKKHFDFGMAVKGIYLEGKGKSNAWTEAGFEKECMEESMKLRSNYAGDGAAGGYLIPDEVTQEFIDLTMVNMPIVSLGTNVIKGLVGDLPVPKKTSRTSAYMVGENVKPTESSAAFGQVTLRPKKVAAFTKQSNRLIYQSRGVSDRIIRDDLMYSMKKKMEDQMLQGTGTGYQAKGILNNTGFTTSSVALGANGGRFRIDDAASMITDMEVADEINFPNAKFGYLFHPRVKGGMKRERVVQYSGGTERGGQPIWPMNLLMTDKILSEQLGYNIAATTLMPSNISKGTSSTCSKVIFGNWDLFWCGIWRDMIIKASDVAGDGSTGSALLDDQIYIVVMQEFDTALMRETAFTVAEGCETLESNWSAA